MLAEEKIQGGGELTLVGSVRTCVGVRTYSTAGPGGMCRSQCEGKRW